MSRQNTEQVTFQITVSVLDLSLKLPKNLTDVRVTVGVHHEYKITCSGKLSTNSQTVTWNHPFLFTALPSTPVIISLCNLPKALTPKWDKQLLSDEINTNVATILQYGDGWQCKVTGSQIGLATLFMTCKPCEALIESDVHDCASALRKYGMKLHEFTQQSKNVACVSTRIEVGLARLDLCPLGHRDHSSALKHLASCFSSRYVQEGNIADLNRAIDIKQMRLTLCPPGHPEHANALGELSITLWKYYCIQKNEADLKRLMEMQQEWLHLCPADNSDHARALGELSLSLKECYDLHGDMSNLDRAIEMGERRLYLCLQDDSNYGAALGNLATFLKARYQRQENITDLDRVIDLQTKCLDRHLSDHPTYALSLRTLALSLKDRYKKTNNHSDLVKAIDSLKESLKAYPVQHRQFALTIDHLAATILLSFQSSQDPPSDEQHPELDEAFKTYERLTECGPAISLDLWKATQTWVKNAEMHNHSSVLEAYQMSLNTLDHFTSFNSSLDMRHETMRAMVVDLVGNAFSCATRRRKFQKAVELLEQGRGILWNQLSRFDISIAMSQSWGNKERELGRRYKELSTNLRKHAEGNEDDGMVPYWRVHDEWKSVVDQIRRLEGFSRFLLPPRFKDLQKAAEYGPVIIANASEYSCDAIIVLRDRPPVHVPLSCSLEEVNQLCSDLLDLTRDMNAYEENRESYVKQLLRDLWTFVVEPVVTVLQNDIQLPSGSRIWWCPTSKFSILPFHAAGPYKKTKKDLMDIYVSSYAPSLSALIRTRDRIRSQKEARGTPGRSKFAIWALVRGRMRCQKEPGRTSSGTANNITFAAVGQPQPSADTKLCRLPQVEHEIKRIGDETKISPGVKFEAVIGDAATIDGAVRAFRDHRWVHLACHGAQHAEKPFESWFAMGDGKLTLMRIIQERYTKSEFAFLSACHTAVGDKSTPDEVLHLAAGMQFAGFNGVIGTLWRVDDTIAYQVVTRFYKEMFTPSVVDFEHAAAALNHAVVESAKEVSLEKRIVFVHIGI